MSQSFVSRLEQFLLRVWYDGYKPAIWHRAWLSALEWIYRVVRVVYGHRRKVLNSKAPTTPPVLVIGNLIAGGAGKTPLVMAVCKALTDKGLKVGIVSRGYGRHHNEVMLLVPNEPLPDAKQVGDEPLYLCIHTHCPVAVAAKRAMAVNTLIETHPDLDLIVSDDGLQHHALKRQIEWVVFDSRGQGNGRLLPAGPLREPIDRLGFVDAVIASNTSIDELSLNLGQKPTERWHRVGVKLTGFRHALTGQWLDTEQASVQWPSTSVAAFTGIANPAKFFHSLSGNGIHAKQTIALPDHHDYADDFCKQFSEEVLITTGKDAVKLNPPNTRLWVAEINLELPPKLIDSLEDCIGPTID